MECYRSDRLLIKNMENFLQINNKITIPINEIECSAIRSKGPGGQNVNKLSTAIHLRFDIKNSSLPEIYKKRLLLLNDKRISKDGIIIIKAQQYRHQKKNRGVALQRLQQLVKSIIYTKKRRIPTRPTPCSQIKRLDSKTRRGKLKILRKKIQR
jgi:ribosome-associated protein